MAEDFPNDPRVYLAAERTLLAWIRTGLAMMGFGFVIARFGLFLQEVSPRQIANVADTAGPSLWIGTALIALGVVATGFAALRHVALVRSLEHGDLMAAHRSALSVVVSFALAAAGVALAVYLIWSTEVRQAGAAEAPPTAAATPPPGSPSAGGHGKVRPMPDYSLFGDEHVRKYEETGGKVGHDWNGTSCLILHTKGRKSGQLRKIPLIYGRDGDNYVLIASKGGAPENPGWYDNLMANPDVSIQVWDKVIPVHARTGNAADKKRVWPTMTAQWPGYDDYQAMTTRDIPVVILTPR